MAQQEEVDSFVEFWNANLYYYYYYYAILCIITLNNKVLLFSKFPPFVFNDILFLRKEPKSYQSDELNLIQT